MAKVPQKGAEEARNQLPALLDAAEAGQSTIITKHGRPVAAIVPVGDLHAAAGQMSLLSLKGTGRGLWGRSAAKTVEALRDEWER